MSEGISRAGGWDPWGWRRRKRDAQAMWRWMGTVRAQWADTVAGTGLARRGLSAGGLPCTTTPVVHTVHLGPPVCLGVRMLPGQVAADYQAHAHRIAEGMGAVMVRLAPDPPGGLRVTLLDSDPLVTTSGLPWRPSGTSARRPILAGADEHGEPVLIDFAQRVHLLIQGHTGSGKSRFTYCLLQQLAADRDALITGCDPSSVLLRPFRDSRHAAWQTLGSNPAQHADLLDRLVREMDTRLGAIPDRCDTLPLTDRHPLMFIVLEEWLGVLGLAGTDKKLRDRLTASARRLATESGKVNMRLIMLVQRAEANEMGGGLLRSQFAWRITLPVDNVESIRLLHPTVPAPLAEAHVTHAQPGTAIYHAPGQNLGRLRTPWVADYAQYWDAITALTGKPRPELKVAR